MMSLAKLAERMLMLYTAVAVPISAQLDLPLDTLSLPPGFDVQLFCNGSVPSARQLAVSEAAHHRIVYIGTDASPGQVFALIDHNQTGLATELLTVLSGLDSLNGVVYAKGSLWVAEITQITHYDDVDSYVLQGKAFPAGTRINNQFPSESEHGLKYTRFGPDGRLYAPVGGPFNVGVCQPYGNIAYCTINRLNANGSDLETVATGVRNSVGYDWHPVDFVVDPDEARPGYNSSELYQACKALGMKFYTGSMFPAAYRNTAFIALHGSWDRQPQIGHAVMNVNMLPDGTVTAYTTFATGWLQNANASNASSWGRPVDVLQLSDGSLLVSGDAEGAIYRFTYQRLCRRSVLLDEDVRAPFFQRCTHMER
ncbi:hypothetical protein WJX72_012240 [[Myrmecia] bisecta]|uniref:Pyrroloquinoline quinone-dependent pyranose dehydrogenase beta-propeller domain-containing protein n=1 Tax=[Myrmecia] bisecta TaxID=41462 RepID=A0AAW1Q1T7_9CHLO